MNYYMLVFASRDIPGRHQSRNDQMKTNNIITGKQSHNTVGSLLLNMHDPGALWKGKHFTYTLKFL